MSACVNVVTAWPPFSTEPSAGALVIVYVNCAGNRLVSVTCSTLDVIVPGPPTCTVIPVSMEMTGFDVAVPEPRMMSVPPLSLCSPKLDAVKLPEKGKAASTVEPLLIVNVPPLKAVAYDPDDGRPGRKIVSPAVKLAIVPANAPGAPGVTAARPRTSRLPSLNFMITLGWTEPATCTVAWWPISIVPPPLDTKVPPIVPRMGTLVTVGNITTAELAMLPSTLNVAASTSSVGNCA